MKNSTRSALTLTMPTVAMITPSDGELHGALAAQWSSSLPPRKAPGMAKTVRMMPKMPSVTVLQPKVAAA